ncbi:hypothetical protein H7100_00270 [Candidatus Saccharibacteria bacterium]|nr:hypothetical protein [Candidatus Saccharibacteria bacterium]
MSETIPVHMRSRGEYDLLYPNHVRAQKLTRHVIYTLMLEIEGDDTYVGRMTVELPRVPVFMTSDTQASAAVEISFMDDDAQPVFQLSGIVKNDELYLVSRNLVLVGDGSVMNHGYFLSGEDEVREAMQFEESLSGGTSTRLFL